ncbi:L-gulonolactone oxidase-like isoform X1 [Tubulanus polymorphus]|uniref:L-gulonolactone oxidase-like isoform X1 n=1 Tax=Tubulanus polymorphus TaxID=672921 RepID=UPI003DA2BAFB
MAAMVEMTGEKCDDFYFENWSRTFSCRPELYFTPENEDQLKQILRLAVDEGRTVKVVGLGRSPSDIACTNEYMISLQKFDRVVEIDNEKFTCTAMAGISIEQLNHILKDSGLSLSQLPAISDISLAGFISTAVHGTGAKFGVCSTNVLEIDLMTSDGEIIHCSRDENKDVFLAACCSLGSLGVIIRAKIQCEPIFNLQRITYPVKLDDVLENLDAHLNASDHFEFFWYPYTEYCIAFHNKRTDAEKTKTKASWFRRIFIGYYLLELLYWFSSFVPSLTRYINRLYLWLNSGHTRTVDWSPNIFNFDCLMKQYVLEYSFPRDKTALVLKELQTRIIQNHHQAHLPIEVRFVKSDDIYLSPAYGRDSTYINIISYRPYGKAIPHSEYWADYEKIVQEIAGRPHWAKAHSMDCHQLKQLYPMWNQFHRVRERLDPRGIFMNRYLRQVFDS